MPVQPIEPPSIVNLPPAPNSVTNPPSEFDAIANSFVSAQVSQVDSYNSANEWVRDTTQQTYDNALESASSAVDSEDSANESAIYAANSAGSANYVGKWSSLSGALNTPASVQHNDSYWILNNDVANVAASEPSTANSDWSILASYRWKIVDVSGNSAPNSYELCKATGADITRNLPAMGAGDFIVFNNSPQSDKYVKIPVVGVTIYGRGGVVNSGDNLILQAGDTAHIAAETATIFRIV